MRTTLLAAHSPDATRQPLGFIQPVRCKDAEDAEGLRRQAFSHMVRSCTALGDFMAARGPSAALDMDELLLRAAMDVIGAPPRCPLGGCQPAGRLAAPMQSPC